MFKKVNLPWLLGFLLFGVFVYKSESSFVKAAATHVVISQVQVAGTTADDEFVELYNPTNSSVDLTGYRLRRETQAGGIFTNLVSSMSGSISSHGYFLVTHPTDYTGSASADEVYSATSSAITANNTILLYSDASTTLVDKVGMGIATDVESSAAALPSTGGSIQRKFDETGGHGMDTDNNASDFESLATSTPRNSSTVVSTPTPSVTPTPTEASTPTPTPTPTETPSPTETPTPTPTETATPTASPTATPTESPVSTPRTSPVPTSTGFPFPTFPPFPRIVYSCKVTSITFNFGFFKITFPQIFCGAKLL